MTVLEVKNHMPDSMLYAAICGLPQRWEVRRDPESMAWKDASVILVSKPGDDFIPAKTVLLASKERGAALEKEHDLNCIYRYMTEAEKIEQLGETDPSHPITGIGGFYSR